MAWREKLLHKTRRRNLMNPFWLKFKTHTYSKTKVYTANWINTNCHYQVQRKGKWNERIYMWTFRQKSLSMNNKDVYNTMHILLIKWKQLPAPENSERRSVAACFITAVTKLLSLWTYIWDEGTLKQVTVPPRNIQINLTTQPTKKIIHSTNKASYRKYYRNLLSKAAE